MRAVADAESEHLDLPGTAGALGVLRAIQGREVATLLEDVLTLRASVWRTVAGEPSLRADLSTLMEVQQRVVEVLDLVLRNAVDAFVTESQKALTRAATRDGLTGLLNRAALLELLATEVAKRLQSPVLLLLDLDRFKHINDTRGHLIGDEVLVATADVIAETVRAGDSVARLGGDEFAVVLPDTSPEEAREVVDRILARAGTASGLRPAGTDGVTFSIGLAWLPSQGDVNALISAADRAMYIAKRAGGSGVHVIAT